MTAARRSRTAGGVDNGTRNVYRVEPDGLAELRDHFERFWGDALERFAAGARKETVTAWEPPSRLVLEWRIGKCAGTEVEVRFSPEGPGARVELEHRGWERIAGATERDGYSAGWDVVLTP